MRINVYSEELEQLEDGDGRRVKLFHKEIEKVLFSAVEMIIGSRRIHTRNGKEVDDDSSAIRFWFSDETSRTYLIAMFEAALEELKKPDARKVQ